MLSEANQSVLTNLHGKRLHEAIVEQFHYWIQKGILEHGAKLPAERVLAEQLKVGRGSVREAIRTLELQGLVTSKQGSGTFINTQNLNAVASLMTFSLIESLGDGEAQLKDIFEVRHLLEPQLAALAAQRATPEDEERLSAILVEQLRQIMEGETGVDADTEFHFALATATHNTALIKVVSAVEDVLRQSRDQTLQQPGRPERSLNSHRRILEMIQAKDDLGALAAMEHHLTEVEPSSINPHAQEQVT
ncbi:MAG: FadR/GntR family transcriptional regulator [Chloroflexota bacterium]|nr:FadR family transcriptional regulator [Dehalococcoidia bacterium]MEE3013091.1 FadR/GntR family transcriptional regulator [Chloroflexota bacterium]